MLYLENKNNMKHKKKKTRSYDQAIYNSTICLLLLGLET